MVPIWSSAPQLHLIELVGGMVGVWGECVRARYVCHASGNVHASVVLLGVRGSALVVAVSVWGY